MIGFALGAFNWFRNSTVGKYALLIGGVVIGLLLFKRSIIKGERDDQKLRDMEFGADIRAADDEVKRRLEKDAAGRSVDDRAADAIERLRAEGRLRD